MAQIPIFRGRVDDDARLVLAGHEREYRRQWLETLRGSDVELIVRKVRTQRSRDQNAYIHAVPVPMLAEHCGYSIAEMKFVLMGECWGWQTVGGHEIPMKIHTSDMTVEEAHHFIDWIIPWAADKFGIEIPLPGEAM